MDGLTWLFTLSSSGTREENRSISNIEQGISKWKTGPGCSDVNPRTSRNPGKRD